MLVAPNKQPVDKPFALNRRASHDYEFIDRYEAGLALTGEEVKSVRLGRASLLECYARFDRRGELWLINAHIAPYQPKPGQTKVQEATRRRKLLLHGKELTRLKMDSEAKGLTIVPIRLYNVRGRIKVEIALARGKKTYNKKEDLKRSDIERDLQRAHKNMKIKL